MPFLTKLAETSNEVVPDDPIEVMHWRDFEPMKPVISYYGGKQRMVSKLLPLLVDHTVYVEPFAGGASLMFRKPWPPAKNNNRYREVINDLDGALVNFYRVLRNEHDGPELVRRLQLTPYAREEHALSADMLRSGATGIDGAWAYYVSVQASFANKLLGGWGTGVYSGNSGATWIKKVSKLEQYLERMSGVHVESLDAIEVIKKWDSPQTLFYCDPPYPGTDQGYQVKYTQEQFNALVDTLATCQGSVLLSCYDNASVPDTWERFEFSATCSASAKGKTGAERDKSQAATNTGDRKRTEVVWRINRSHNARHELQKVWEQWEAKGFKFGTTLK